MKHLLLCLGLILVVSAYSAPASAADKEIFVANKCDMCHSISSLGLESKKKSGAIDLSDTGTRHDAAFFKDFLEKKTANPTSGKQHPVATKGDVQKLAEALAQLKGPAK